MQILTRANTGQTKQRQSADTSSSMGRVLSRVSKFSSSPADGRFRKSLLNTTYHWRHRYANTLATLRNTGFMPWYAQR